MALRAIKIIFLCFVPALKTVKEKLLKSEKS